MVRIAILGDPGSGGTAVLGLLYAAQVRMSSAEDSAFRFHVAPSSMARVGAIFEALRAGDFPSHAPGAPSGPVEFLFERHPTLVASIRGRLGRGQGSNEAARTVTWTRASFDDLRRHLESGGFPTDGARQLEGVDVLLVLVPTPPAPAESRSAKAGADDALLQMLSQAGRSPRQGSTAAVRMAFVFTMLDRLSDARRKELGLSSDVQGPIPPDRRTGIGLRLLGEALPKTRALLYAQTPAQPPTGAPPRVFFSWIETDPMPSGRPRLRPAPGGGWEPAYPFSEYAALIGACGEWSEGRA